MTFLSKINDRYQVVAKMDINKLTLQQRNIRMAVRNLLLPASRKEAEEVMKHAKDRNDSFQVECVQEWLDEMKAHPENWHPSKLESSVATVDDSFECEKCHNIFDIEDSVKDSKKGEMHCPDCAKKGQSKMPNANQLAVLKDYATKHGSRWKDKLLSDWTKGKSESPLLQQIRNQFGPEWLASYKG